MDQAGSGNERDGQLMTIAFAQRRLKPERIAAAAGRIDPIFTASPQFVSDALSSEIGCTALLKVETVNPIRCFKGRGADWLIQEAVATGDDRPMICASAGNFGQAMAYAATKAGRRITIYAAETANALKLDRMRALGGDVVVTGRDFDAAKAAAKRVAAEQSLRMVEDSRDIETAEGAGTIGLELARGAEAFDAVIVPIGNGAMINGIATAIKDRMPDVRVIGVQARGAPAMKESWERGEPVETEQADTICDGIAVRVPVPEAVADMEGLIDDVLLVDDATTVRGMRLLHAHAGLVSEPSAGIAIGAALAHSELFRSQTVAFIVCGGNLTPDQMRQWLS
ncbi:MAG: pyridoxal-phosphate dependent enzyme [Pseudomonadota bacterium]